MFIYRNKQEMQEELTRIKFHTDKLEARLAGLPEEFDYPLCFESSRTGVIVEFISMQGGTVIAPGAGYRVVGITSTVWIPHTNREEWTPVTFNKKRGLYDKQLVWGSDNGVNGLPILEFYDAINDRVFSRPFGSRKGVRWDNMIPAFIDEPWVQVEYDKLED